MKLLSEEEYASQVCVGRLAGSGADWTTILNFVPDPTHPTVHTCVWNLQKGLGQKFCILRTTFVLKILLR